jgi:hypothetical protein
MCRIDSVEKIIEASKREEKQVGPERTIRNFQQIQVGLPSPN